MYPDISHIGKHLWELQYSTPIQITSKARQGKARQGWPLIQSGSDLKTIINRCNAGAMFWVKIKTVFNLNFIPQAINPDVYCWFFKIFYVNTDPGHALFICSELLEFSLVSNHPQSSAYFISKSFTPEMVLPDSWPLSALSRHYVLFHYDFTILCKSLEKMSEMPA